MPKIDLDAIPVDISNRYPEPYRNAVEGRARKRLGVAAGLDQFGVNLTRLAPGAASSLRHWHQNEDELVFMLEGEVVLIEDAGETVLRSGDGAAWKAGLPNGHCLVNRSDRVAVFLEIGTRATREQATYSDIDMRCEREGTEVRFVHASGEPYPT